MEGWKNGRMVEPLPRFQSSYRKYPSKNTYNSAHLADRNRRLSNLWYAHRDFFPRCMRAENTVHNHIREQDTLRGYR